MTEPRAPPPPRRQPSVPSDTSVVVLSGDPRTLVLLMALDRIGAVVSTLIGLGRPGTCPVSVIADGTMPTQRTINSTLEDVERRLADEDVRPSAVVVTGGVVSIAAEFAWLGRELGGNGRDGPGAVLSPVPPLAKDH